MRDDATSPRHQSRRRRLQSINVFHTQAKARTAGLELLRHGGDVALLPRGVLRRLEVGLKHVLERVLGLLVVVDGGVRGARQDARRALLAAKV